MMPIVILQAAAFTAISAAFRSATDAVAGLNRRFGAMPINPFVPVAARMSGNVFRLVIALTTALVCGYVIGFRFRLDAAHTLGFVVFALLVGIALTLAADVIGTLSKSPEATTQALVLPPLILGMLSTGLAPAAQFPEWVQPFVRNQPVSQFVIALRALVSDTLGNMRRGVVVADGAAAGLGFRHSRGLRAGGGAAECAEAMMTLPAARPADLRTAPETSAAALIRHTVIQTQRLLLRWARNPITLLETLLIPCLLLLMLDIVVGGQIQKFTGQDALYGSVPMVAVVGALSGAVAAWRPARS